MHWTRLDQRWQARGDALEGQALEAGITYQLSHWKVPGESSLPIRVVTREGFPLRSYTPGFELAATSITLHESNGYGNFSRLMGGNSPQHPSHESVHFVVGRDGNAYLVVPIDRVAWHAGDWSMHSIGVEIDSIGPLHERDEDGVLYSAFGDTDEYCSKGDTDQFVRESFHGTDYWAAWTDAQYDCTARLLKAICHRAKIARYIQDEHSRFTPLNRLSQELQLKFRGITSHYQVDPSHGADIGPTIDWRRLVDSAGLIEGDCFHTPPYADEETAHPAQKPFRATSSAVQLRAVHGDFKLAGDYVAGRGFVDRDLNGLLQHYCEEDNLEPTHTDWTGLPAWLASWQNELPKREWNAEAQGRARLVEAYLRAHFRAECKAKGLDYALAADELFATAAVPERDAELDLERTPGFGAARRALSRSLGSHGWLLDGDRDWTPPQDETRPLRPAKLMPGDAITFAAPEGLRAGRIGTVLFADGESGDEGMVWLAATEPASQSIKIERFNLEETPENFSPLELEADIPREAWRAGEESPKPGGAWVIEILRTSAVQRPKVDRMTDAERSHFALMQGELEVTPGTVLSTAAKLRAGEPLIADHKIRFDVRELAGAKNPYPLREPPLAGTERKRLGPPIPVAAHSVRLTVGEKPGRLAFRIVRPAPKSPAAQPATSVNGPYAEDERDAFIQIVLSALGAPYLPNSTDPAAGLDGVALVAMGLRQIGILPAADAGPALTASGLSGMFSFLGGTLDAVPDGLVPGDLAWFGAPSRDLPAQQHPMVYLGNGKGLGPVPDGGPRGSAVQILALDEVAEQFAGWTHIDDLGTAHTEPGAFELPAESTATIGAALLPASAASRYQALKNIAKDKKSTWFNEQNQVNLIGIKNLHGRVLILPAEDGWNDTVFAAWLDERGHQCCLEMRAALNPGTDKNHAETWTLLEGGYQFHIAQGDGIDTQTLQPGGEIRGFFDENSAGVLGVADRKTEGDKLVSKGDYTKVPIQLAPGSMGSIARPTKGTQLIWGGHGAGSPWGQLSQLIEKSGAPVSYLLLSAAELAQRTQATMGAPGAMPISGTDKKLQSSDQQGPLQIDPKPNPNAPGLHHASGPSGRGRLFDAGLNVSYQGEAMRLWAHPRAANSGPRPLIIYLHDINPNSDQHPALSAEVGKANLPWMHMGKLAQRLIEQGKVTPLAIAAPTNAAAAPWGTVDFQDVLNLAENKFKESGVEIDPTQIAVVGHGGAAGYELRGMLKLAAEHAQIGDAKLKIFGLADARITAGVGDAIREGLAGNEVTAVYSLHRAVGGWAGAEHFESGGTEGFAKALGASESNTTHVVGDEEFSSIGSYWDNGDERPTRVSIQVNASMGNLIPRWRKAGAYGAGDLGSHANTVARWTAWALPRFFAQTATDKTLLALDHEHQPQAGLNAPEVPANEFNVPPAAKPWVNPAGSIPPKALDGFEFAPATGLFYPLRAEKLPAGRGVYYVGNDDASYGPSGKGGAGGAWFLANRGREGRKLTGVEVGIGALNAMVVAAEAGTIVDFVKLHEDAWNLILQTDSGTALVYGELDKGSLEDHGLKKGAHVAAGQPIGQLRKNQGEARLVFETYRNGTTGTIPYYPNATEGERLVQRENVRQKLLNPTLYLLALARAGR